MFPLFLAAWALGAWLLVITLALIWTERIRIHRRLPICAGCGYSMEGLGAADRCPECNSNRRRVRSILGTPRGSPALVWTWALPAVTALVITIPAAILFNLTINDSLALLLAMLAAMLAFGGLARWQSRWLPPVAIIRVTIFGTISIVLGLLGLAAAVHATGSGLDTAAILLIPPLLMPFAGYGIAIAVASVPAEEWFRGIVARRDGDE